MPHKLVIEAQAAAKHAYSPYSNWRVGCAVVFAERPEWIILGANVENASFSLTQCAERAAICAGVSSGLRKIAALGIACLDADNNPAPCFYPCGACLQVISEFADEKTEILLDRIGVFKLVDLLRAPFTLQNRVGS